jgi:hypothetical protein
LQGTATEGVDFQPADGTLSGQVVFEAPGVEHLGTIQVNVIGDDLTEPNETFSVHLSGSATCQSGASIATFDADATISDDDDIVIEPPVSVSITDVTVKEDGRSAIFTVFLSRPAGTRPVLIDFKTHGGSATPGLDFQPLAGTLAFGPLQRLATIEVPILDDSLIERPEQFSVQLSNPRGVLIGDGTGVATILDVHAEI